MKLRTASTLLCTLLTIALTTQAPAQTYSRNGAARYMASQNWPGLAQYATAWTRAEPNNPDGWAYLGMVYGLHLHDPARAASAINHSLQLNPNQPDGWEALGVADLDLNQNAAAVTAIRHAIQLNPNQYAYYNNLAAAYAAQADWNDALRTLNAEQPLAQRLNNAQVWYVLGNAYLRMEKAAPAVAAYQHVLQLNPRFGAGWNNLGSALAWGGNSQGALNAYNRGAQLGDPMARKNVAEMQQRIAAQKQSLNSTNSPADWLMHHSYGLYMLHQAAQH